MLKLTKLPARPVYMTDEEAAEITEAANRESRSFSNFLRVAALERARQSDPTPKEAA